MLRSGIRNEVDVVRSGAWGGHASAVARLSRAITMRGVPRARGWAVVGVVLGLACAGLPGCARVASEGHGPVKVCGKVVESAGGAFFLLPWVGIGKPHFGAVNLTGSLSVVRYGYGVVTTAVLSGRCDRGVDFSIVPSGSITANVLVADGAGRAVVIGLSSLRPSHATLVVRSGTQTRSTSLTGV